MYTYTSYFLKTLTDHDIFHLRFQAEVDAQVATREEETGEGLSAEQVNQIFLEVNKPDNKGLTYGLGSLGQSFGTPRSSSSSQLSRHQVLTQAQVSEMVQSQMQSQLQSEVARIAEEMERRNAQLREEMNEQVRLQMQSFMSQYSQHPPPPSS